MGEPYANFDTKLLLRLLILSDTSFREASREFAVRLNYEFLRRNSARFVLPSIQNFTFTSK